MKKALLSLLLCLPIICLGQDKTREYVNDSFFTINFKNNNVQYVEIMPYGVYGDTVMSLYEFNLYGETAAVFFDFSDGRNVSMSINNFTTNDLNLFYKFGFKYLFWRIADYYNITIK